MMEDMAEEIEVFTPSREESENNEPVNSNNDVQQENNNNNIEENENQENQVNEISDDTPPRQSIQERIQIYEAALTINPIDRKVIQKLAFRGIPDSQPSLRSAYWKILLNYHSDDNPEQYYENSRKIYHDFIQELILDPHAKYAKFQEENVEDVTMDDHPLSQNKKSVWNQYFADNEMMDEIDKDVKRTFPHLHFFNKDGLVGSTRHYEALRRILFIYAKLNPGIRYVQGMNEVLGPIYYVCAIDPNCISIDNAEADAFHCFTNLMSEIRDNFCKTLDNSLMGIAANMRNLNQLTKKLDFELWTHLGYIKESQGMNPQFYSFRWLTLLLSQEFDLPDVIRLWDCLFADTNRFEFLLYCCNAMIQCIRPKLMMNEFADNLKQLQNFPQDIEITTILRKAEELRNPPTATLTPTPTPPLTPIHNNDNNEPKDSPPLLNSSEKLSNNNLKNSKESNGFFSRLRAFINEKNN